MRDPGRPVDVLSSSGPGLTQAFIHLLLDVWHRHVRRRKRGCGGVGVGRGTAASRDTVGEKKKKR